MIFTVERLANFFSTLLLNVGWWEGSLLRGSGDSDQFSVLL